MGIARNCAAVAVSTLVVAAALGPAADHRVGLRSSEHEIALTANTLPIIDVDWTLGPLNLVRQLTASFDDSVPDEFSAMLDAVSKTTLTSPGNFLASLGWKAKLPVSVEADPGDDAILSLTPEVSGTFSVAAGGSSIGGSGVLNSNLTPILYRGGNDGYGVGFTGYALTAATDGTVDLGDVGYATGNVSGSLLYLDVSQLTVTPSGGLKASFNVSPVFGSALAEIGTADSNFRASAGLTTYSYTDLCTQSTDCDGNLAHNVTVAQFNGTLDSTGPFGPLAITLDIPNFIDVALKPDRLSIIAQIGGTLTIGSQTFGRIVPIDIQIPFPVALPLAAVKPESGATTRTTTAATVRAAAAETTTEDTAVKNTSTHDRPTAKTRAVSRGSRSADAVTPHHAKSSSARPARAQRSAAQ